MRLRIACAVMANLAAALAWMHHYNVASFTFVDQWKKRGISNEAAVPITLAVNLDRVH